MPRRRPGSDRWVALAIAVLLLGACSGQQAARTAATPAPPPVAAAPSPALPACAPAQADTRAPGVSSADPVLELASGLDRPDDLLVDGDQVLVGELGSGRIARLGGDAPVGGYERLPVHVPVVEGLARIGDTLYAADQANDRVVAIRGDQVSTFFQLQPVRGLEGVDGIAAAGATLIVPDSPRGAVLFIGQGGEVQRRVGGFARPTGAWPLADGAVLVADENAGSVVRLAPDGGRQALVSGLPLADDVVADADGRVYAISIGRNSLVQLAGGAASEVAAGLKQPQGLGLDQAANVLVTEYDAGRLDAVVRTFRLLPAIADGPALGNRQPLCVRVVRAPGFQDPVSVEPGPGYQVVAEPGAGLEGAVLPAGCSGLCRVRVSVRSGQRTDSVTLAYRR